MGGKHHFVELTEYVSINGTGKQDQLILMLLKLNLNGAERSCLNLHPKIGGTLMKRVCFLCKCPYFYF